MPNITNEENIKEKLEYIGLNLDEIPEFLKEFHPLDFRISKTHIDNEYKIYKYVPIDKIQILLTDKNRLEDIKEKYKNAQPIYKFLNPNNEEDIENYAIFLNMLKEVKISKIKEIEEMQKELNKQIPFSVKYNKNYEWQIYYSENTDRYFMMFPIQDMEYESLFYLIKQQIEFEKSRKKIAPSIFVPISYLNYSGNILKTSEITEIESYLWLFTKEWPLTYEVYGKKGENEIRITGETLIYEKIKSKYQIKLLDKEDAVKFYKFIKALFVLQTELPEYYKFTTKINDKSELEFYYNSQKMNYDKLLEFIKEQYIKVQNLNTENTLKLKQLEEELIKLKNEAIKKESIFLAKQKEIATYLQCKKTFFGRVKYFIKKNKKVKVQEENLKEETIKKEETNDIVYDKKREYYAIEDLIAIYYTFTKDNNKINNMTLDIDALNNKIENIEKKIKNADEYIKEIDKHKKSIFAFWKFAKKDESNLLVQGEEKKQENSSLRKIFDYSMDIEELGEKADKLQRDKLDKNQQDSIFALDSKLINSINIIKRQIEENRYNDTDDKIIEQELNCFKSTIQEEYYTIDKFDIFGSIGEGQAKLKELGNKKHREVQKDIIKILEITENTSIFEFKDTLKKVYNNIKQSMEKIKSLYDMSIYFTADKIEKENYVVAYINPEDALRNNIKEEINLYKINIKEDTPLIYYTNIIYYDNYNKTLPIGMNVNSKVLIDLSKINLEEITKETIKTNMYINKNNMLPELKVQNIIISEYKIDEK